MGLKKAFSSSVHSKNSDKSSNHSESDATAIGDDIWEFQSDGYQFENERTDSTTSTAIPDDAKVFIGSIYSSHRDSADEHVVYSDDSRNESANDSFNAGNDNSRLQSELGDKEEISQEMGQGQQERLHQSEKLRDNSVSLKEEKSSLVVNANNSEQQLETFRRPKLSSSQRRNFETVDILQDSMVSRKVYNKVLGERLEVSMTNKELMSRISGLGQLVMNVNHMHNETMRKLREEAFRAQKVESILIDIKREFEDQKIGLNQRIYNLTEINEGLTWKTQQMKNGYEETICKLIRQRVEDLKQLQLKMQDDKSTMKNARKGKLDCTYNSNDVQEEDNELHRKFETFVQIAPYGSNNEVLIDKRFYDQLKYSYLTIENQRGVDFKNEQQFQNLQAQHGELQQKFLAQEKELQHAKGTVQDLYSILSGTISGSISALGTGSLDGEQEVEFSDQATPVEEANKAFAKSKWKKICDGGFFSSNAWSTRSSKALRVFRPTAN